MARIVGYLISEFHRRLLRRTIFAVSAGLVLVVLCLVMAKETRRVMDEEALSALGGVQQRGDAIRSAFASMKTDVTAEPCSQQFFHQLSRIAFRPDGLSEFVYAPGGTVRCSLNAGVLKTAVPLGKPHLRFPRAPATALWIDVELGFLGLEELYGNVILDGDFGLVIPKSEETARGVPWLHSETVYVGDDGSWWHRDGAVGLYHRLSLDSATLDLAPLRHGAFRTLSCPGAGLVCIASEARLSDLVVTRWPHVTLAVVFALCTGFGAARAADGFIGHYWSFEARFRREFGPKTILCVYQPILDVSNDRMSACEVLVRWRDIDDGVVTPDRFLPLVERDGLTRRLTELVIARAYRELSAALPADERMIVHFNVFPQDLVTGGLAELFAPFLAEPARFEVVVEIIETASLMVDSVHDEIARLRAAGIRTYIDDFGSGYCNIQTLAVLAIDGVKLDRSFGMAPLESLAARMLDHAIDMIQVAGRAIVVEGVETAERLEWLRAAASVDYAQGYLISRPLSIDSFVRFLAADRAPVETRRAA